MPLLRRAYSSVPRIAQPGVWRSMVPKSWRRASPPAAARLGPGAPAPQPKPFNPFFVYALIFLFIGSNAVNQIGLRNQLAAFTRKTDAQLALLNEVVRRVHAGEEVDVEGLLGAGDKKREDEWDQVLREVEGVDELWERQKRRPGGKDEPEAKKPEPAAAESKADAAVESKADAPKKKFGFY